MDESIDKRKVLNSDYDVRIASQGFANIAGVFAGFAFTAVILVVQMNGSFNSQPDTAAIRDLAVVSFLVSFFGCIISAFLFSVTAGEKELTHRSHDLAQLAGIGFSISMSLAFWGLAKLLNISVSASISNFVNLIFPFIVSLQPAFIAANSLEGYEHNYRQKKRLENDFLYALAPGYVPLVIAIFLKCLGFGINPLYSGWSNLIFGMAISLIILSYIFTFLRSFVGKDKRLSILQNGLIVGLHSIVISLLISSI
jgi:hypothetical protein